MKTVSVPSYRKFAKEADTFRKLLSVQKAIFRTQCSILLQELVDHDAALAMLNRACHFLQIDDELEKQLDRLLGESKEPCAVIISTIHDKLSVIENESEQLGIIIEQERQLSMSRAILEYFAIS